jgi:hypothetical protein
MSLPASQQNALDAIDDGLRHGDPRLARMFAVFTRLTRQESMPARETLPPRQWWPSRGWRAGPHGPHPQRSLAGRVVARLLVPLLLAAALSLLITSILANPSASRRCSHASGRSATARLMIPVACPSASPAGAAQVAK